MIGSCAKSAPRAVTLGLAILLATTGAWADDVPVPVAPTDCRGSAAAHDAAPAASVDTEQVRKQPASRSAPRYLAAAEAIKQSAAADTVLIDLRRPTEFAELRIPGALNIPPHQIKTKGFLRNKHLLLVDAGYRYGSAERTAAELEAAGFEEVRIIEGGLNAWHAAGGELLGPAPPSRLRTVAPAELAAEARFAHWRVVMLGAAPVDPAAPPAAASSAALPATTVSESVAHLLDAPAARLGDDAPERLPALAAALSTTADGDLAPLILLVDTAGHGAAGLLAQLGNDAPWNLFVLDGGLNAWQVQARKLAAMQARRLAPPPRLGACGG